MYTEEKINKIIRQRNRAEEVIDQIKTMLGIEDEWSNRYGYEEFLDDAKAIIDSKRKADETDKTDESGICTHCGFPRKLPGKPCELCHIV